MTTIYNHVPWVSLHLRAFDLRTISCFLNLQKTQLFLHCSCSSGKHHLLQDWRLPLSSVSSAPSNQPFCVEQMAKPIPEPEPRITDSWTEHRLSDNTKWNITYKHNNRHCSYCYCIYSQWNSGKIDRTLQAGSYTELKLKAHASALLLSTWWLSWAWQLHPQTLSTTCQEAAPHTEGEIDTSNTIVLAEPVS